MPLHRATKYLKNVISQKEIIPFRRFMGGVGKNIYRVSQENLYTSIATVSNISVQIYLAHTVYKD